MRITESKTRVGYFWLPDSPESKLPGTLRIFDGGKIELKLIGIFGDHLVIPSKNPYLGRILGKVEKDRYITLESCLYQKRDFSLGGISRSLVYVQEAIFDIDPSNGGEARFDSFSFSIEGLDEWVGISGINVVNDSDLKSTSITYQAQSAMKYCLGDGFTLKIVFSYKLPGMPVLTEAKVSQKTYFVLDSDVERELEAFRDVAHKLTYLLCLAIDATVSIRDVKAESNSHVQNILPGEPLKISMPVYYQSIPFSSDVPNIDIYKMLFRFQNIEKNAGDIIKNWLGAYSIFRPSLDLYFSSVTGGHKYLESRFLSLAQSLETYHRRTSTESLMAEDKFRSVCASLLCSCPKKQREWFKSRLNKYDNEVNLGRRIKSIIEPFKTSIGNSKQRKKLIHQIVNTRNYFTHYDTRLEDDAISGKDLWNLCQRMEALFQLHLLSRLGFDKSEIDSIVSNNDKLSDSLQNR